MAIIYGYPDAEKRLLDKLPKEVESIDDIHEVHREMKDQYDSMDRNGIVAKFRRWNKKRQINKIEENIDSPLYHGAKGELKVLDKLSELSEDYHIFCDVYMELDHYVTYDGRRDLRSAQMDFVVVSYRGVVLIEAKNWSSRYIRQHDGLYPHEQVDRAGRVLWISLKSSWWSPRNPSVTSVLLSIRGNMEYDPDYKFVNIKDLKNINYFIQNRYEQFSDKEVERLVNRI